MSDGLSVLIKKICGQYINNLKPSDLYVGTVLTANPLAIRVDAQKVLTEEFLILARNVTDHQTWISFDNPDIKQKIQFYDRAEKESKAEPLPMSIEAGQEPHALREDDIPPPEKQNTTDILFLKKWYKNTLQIKDKNGDIPAEIELPAFHEITVYNHLRAGERVIMVRALGGQQYYVIDRIGVVP